MCSKWYKNTPAKTSSKTKKFEGLLNGVEAKHKIFYKKDILKIENRVSYKQIV